MRAWWKRSKPGDDAWRDELKAAQAAYLRSLGHPTYGRFLFSIPTLADFGQLQLRAYVERFAQIRQAAQALAEIEARLMREGRWWRVDSVTDESDRRRLLEQIDEAERSLAAALYLTYFAPAEVRADDHYDE